MRWRCRQKCGGLVTGELVFGRVIRARSGTSLSLNLFLRLLSSRNLVSKKWESQTLRGGVPVAQLLCVS
jgi:hypothetical protein